MRRCRPVRDGCSYDVWSANDDLPRGAVCPSVAPGVQDTGRAGRVGGCGCGRVWIGRLARAVRLAGDAGLCQRKVVDRGQIPAWQATRYQAWWARYLRAAASPSMGREALGLNAEFDIRQLPGSAAPRSSSGFVPYPTR